MVLYKKKKGGGERKGKLLPKNEEFFREKAHTNTRKPI